MGRISRAARAPLFQLIAIWLVHVSKCWFTRAGTDVMIFKIFSPKKNAKKFAFLTRNNAKLCKILIITFVFEKNANFFAKNWQKSLKIVIITSTPGPILAVRPTKVYLHNPANGRCRTTRHKKWDQSYFFVSCRTTSRGVVHTTQFSLISFGLCKYPAI
jgi:hypothetical protein